MRMNVKINLSWNPNNTYHVVHQLVFNFALAIIITKTNDRHNDVKVDEAGRYKFMDLFFGFNHPIYQEIEYCDLRQKTVMPSEVLEQRNKNLTYTISEKEGKHQGGDFILEGKVRRQKMFAPKGSDTEIMLRNVSRSLDDIINITKSVNDKLHIHELDGERVTSISFEVL